MSPPASRRGSTQVSAQPRDIPSASQLETANRSELVDKDGQTTTFGALTSGKRVAVIFIRHFWCGICQAYIAQLATSIPPSSLPEGTSLIIIGCGNYQPIQTYTEATESPYPIYGNPSADLYKLFGFSVNLSPSKKGEERKYTSTLGSQFNRVWDALKAGPMKNIGHVSSVGPKSQNGGEMILEADGTCSFMYRMQNTADHTDLDELAKVIGATYIPPSEPYKPGSKPSSPLIGSEKSPVMDDKRRSSLMPDFGRSKPDLEKRRASEAI